MSKGMSLKNEVKDDKPRFDILAWWKMKATKYHVISFMVRDILIIPMSTVSFESAFNTGSLVLDPFHSSLSLTMVEALICAQNWLKADKQKVNDLQVELDETKKIESSVKTPKFFSMV